VILGAVHSDELSYIFMPAIPLSNETASQEVVTKNRMVNMIANFVKHGYVKQQDVKSEWNTVNVKLSNLIKE